MSTTQDLKFFKLDTASLGVQEIFKSAPVAVKVPSELLDWVRAVIWEYIQKKGNTDIHNLMIAIRTKAIENGFSSQQIVETIERAAMENTNRVEGKHVHSRFQKLTN